MAPRVIHTTILSSFYARMPLQKIRPRDNHAPQDIADLPEASHWVIVITGGGISTSCDIPDFRSKRGLYSLITDEALPPPPLSTPSTPSHSIRRRPDNDPGSTNSSGLPPDQRGYRLDWLPEALMDAAGIIPLAAVATAWFGLAEWTMHRPSDRVF
jgi:Sir2 family